MGSKRGFNTLNVIREKKGQMSIFLALAVVLVLLVGAYLLFQNYLNRQNFSTDLTDPALSPIQKYVLTCLEDSLQSGLLLAANQGGYVQVPDEIARNPRLYVSAHPDAPIKTPLWISEGRSYIPTYETMESQLATHIDQTIKNCIQDFSSLNDISNVEELSSPKASVTINERDVTAHLNYTVSYNEGDKSQTINEFNYVLSVPLKQMMESAKALAQQLNDKEFFELATIDLLSASDPTIPVSNMLLSCDKPTWQVSDVRNSITQLLYQMIPRTRVLGAENTPFDASSSTYESLNRITPDDFSEPAVGNGPIKQKTPRGYTTAPEDVYEYNHLYFDSGIKDQLKKNGVTVSFSYEPNYGLDMAVRPSDGITMSGTTGTGENKYLKFLCIQVYHFTYDLLFPIQATIIKEKAFKDGTSLALRFALPVQIQRNLPNKDGFSLTNVEANVPGGRLCEDKVSYKTTVKATNRATGAAIDGAKVEFHCYKYACDLGTTSRESNYEPQLVTSIPSFCSGGSVEVTHPDYVSAQEAFYSAPDLIQLEMFPLRNISFSVALGPNPAVYTKASPADLTINQEAAVHVVSNEIDYETYGSFKPGEDSTIQLIAGAGTYNITVFVYEVTDEQDTALVGAYIGQLRVRTADLNRHLNLYARDYINPISSDDVAGKLVELANDTVIITSHAPGWS